MSNLERYWHSTIEKWFTDVEPLEVEKRPVKDQQIGISRGCMANTSKRIASLCFPTTHSCKQSAVSHFSVVTSYMIDTMKTSSTEQAIHTLDKDELAELRRYADAMKRKFGLNSRTNDCQGGEAFVQAAILKILNAEKAIANGHAAIINGRIQILRELRNNTSIMEMYSEGLRFWDTRKHTLIGFLKLVILSDIRALLMKRDVSSPRNSLQLDLDQIEDHFSPSPEHSVSQKLAVDNFVRSLDSSELRGIAELILFSGYSVTDIMVELGLTRSQADKRIGKVLEHARRFAAPN